MLLWHIIKSYSHVKFDFSNTAYPLQKKHGSNVKNVFIQDFALRKKRNLGKNAGCFKRPISSGIVAKMIMPPGRTGVALKPLWNHCSRWKYTKRKGRELHSLYTGKANALNRFNYKGLRLINQVINVFERVLEQQNRQQIQIDDMQFGFMPAHGIMPAVSSYNNCLNNRSW